MTEELKLYQWGPSHVSIRGMLGNEDYDVYPPRFADGYVEPSNLAPLFEFIDLLTPPGRTDFNKRYEFNVATYSLNALRWKAQNREHVRELDRARYARNRGRG